MTPALFPMACDKAAMEKALRLDTMLHAFMFTLSGVPVLYSGDEIAAENDYSYHDDPLRKEDSRYLHRGNMDWMKARKRTKKTTPEGILFAALKQMEDLRAEHAVFDTEADTWLLDTGNEHVLGIGRYYRGEKMVALFNFSDEAQVAWIHEQEPYTGMMDGKRYDTGAVKLPAGGFLWLVYQFGGDDVA